MEEEGEEREDDCMLFEYDRQIFAVACSKR